MPCTREILGVGARRAVRADQSRRGMAEQALAGGAVRRRGARSCGERLGLRSAVLWGPDEATLAAAVARASGGAARMAPQTTMVEMLALARAAQRDGVGRHGAAAPGRRRRHAGRRRCTGRRRPGATARGIRATRSCRVTRLRLRRSSGSARRDTWCLEQVTVDAVDGCRARAPGGRVTAGAQCRPPRRAPDWRAGACRSASRPRRWCCGWRGRRRAACRSACRSRCSGRCCGSGRRDTWRRAARSHRRGRTGSRAIRCISGSSLMGVGLALAANHWAVALLIGAYLGAHALAGHSHRGGVPARDLRRRLRPLCRRRPAGGARVDSASPAPCATRSTAPRSGSCWSACSCSGARRSRRAPTIDR